MATPELMREPAMPTTPTATQPPAPLPINVATETLLSLSQAAKRFPPFRQGRPVSSSTVWRRAHDGIVTPEGNRVRLEAVRLGGRWLTAGDELLLSRRRRRRPQPQQTGGATGTRTPRQRQARRREG